MNFSVKISRLIAIAGVAIAITACSQNESKSVKPEPAATGDSLMRTMNDTLANAKAFSFETSERIEAVAKEGEKGTIQFTRKVTVRRPNGLYFELQSKGDAPFEIAAYYDGKTVTVNEKPNGPWTQTAVPATLDEMLDDVSKRFGFAVPFGDVVYSSPQEALIGTKSRGGLTARETIDGVECLKLEYGDEFVDVTLWLPASGPALPNRLELAYKRTSIPLTTQINFKNWKLDAQVTDAMFTFQPPAGTAPIDFGKFTSGVASRSMPAGPKGTPSGSPDSKPSGSPK